MWLIKVAVLRLFGKNDTWYQMWMNNNSQYSCIVQNEYSILLLLINVIVIAINDYKSEGIKGGGGRFRPR